MKVLVSVSLVSMADEFPNPVDYSSDTDRLLADMNRTANIGEQPIEAPGAPAPVVRTAGDHITKGP